MSKYIYIIIIDDLTDVFMKKKNDQVKRNRYVVLTYLIVALLNYESDVLFFVPKLLLPIITLQLNSTQV